MEKSPYDAAMAKLDGAQGVTKSKESTVRTMPLWGIEGGSEMWVVQTVRQADVGEFIFVDHITDAGSERLVLPPEISAVLYRQRDAVSAKHRSAVSRATMQQRMAEGFVPKPPRRRRRA